MMRGWVIAVGCAVLLAGCQEDGAPRPIHIEKGVYQGTPDTPRSEDELRALQQRTATQRF